MHRPIFSMPSVVDRLRNLKSDVPKVIMDQAATEVERYLLEQTSYLNQQNVIIGGALDAVVTQTTLTNGRVGNQEEVTNAQQIVLDAYKLATEKWHRWLKWFLAFLAFIGVPIASILFKWLAVKLNIPVP